MSFMRVLYVPVYFTKYMGLVNVIIILSNHYSVF